MSAVTTDPDDKARPLALLALLVLPLVASAALTPLLVAIGGDRFPALDENDRLARSSACRRAFVAGDVIVAVHQPEGGPAATARWTLPDAGARFRDLLGFLDARFPAAEVELSEGRIVATQGILTLRGAAGNRGELAWDRPGYERKGANRRVRKPAHYLMLAGFWFFGWLILRQRNGAVFFRAGLTPPRPRLWGRGFALGALTLALFFLIALAVGKRSLDYEGHGRLLGAIAGYLPLALLIGLLEDVAFFGFLGALTGRRWALTATVFAATHFLHPDGSRLYEGPEWALGFEAVSAALFALSGMLERPGELLGLWLVGACLAWLRDCRGTLWLGMGLHGGWYWARAVGRRVCDNETTSWDWLAGSGVFYDGVFGWLALIGTWALAARISVSPITRGGNPDGFPSHMEP